MTTKSPDLALRSPTVAAGVFSLLALTAIIYFPVARFGFVNYDDPTYVVHNTSVQAGFCRESLHYAFTANFGGWSPLVWISYLADRQFFAASPAAIHIENVFWHGCGGILLWILLTKITAATWRSWIVAALFLAHPMHVESVAWISERKDVLSTPLLLAAMLAYWSYCTSATRCRSAISYCLMMLLLALSLMTKAMGVTFPILLLLLDYWPLKRMPARIQNFPACLLIEKIPIAILALIFSVISMEAQQAGGATAAGAVIPLADRLSNGIVCYTIYIAKLAIPTNLAAFYVHPGSRPFPVIIAAVGLLLLISWLVIKTALKCPIC